MQNLQLEELHEAIERSEWYPLYAELLDLDDAKKCQSVLHANKNVTAHYLTVKSCGHSHYACSTCKLMTERHVRQRGYPLPSAVCGCWVNLFSHYPLDVN